MGFTGKLMAASMLIGAAAGVYASQYMGKGNTQNNNCQPTSTNSPQGNWQNTNSQNSWQSTGGTGNTSWHGNLQTGAQSTSQTTASESGIDYNYDSRMTSNTTQTPVNVYLEDESNPQPVEDKDKSCKTDIKADII